MMPFELRMSRAQSCLLLRQEPGSVQRQDGEAARIAGRPGDLGRPGLAQRGGDPGATGGARAREPRARAPRAARAAPQGGAL